MLNTDGRDAQATKGRPWSLIGKLGYRDYVLLILILIYVVQFLDRNVLTVLAQPIKEEFGLSDAQLGLLTGFIFTIPYGLMLWPAGYLADRVNGRNVLAAALFVWSLLTLVTGFVQRLWQLITMRSVIATAEAFYFPNALRIVADYYDRGSRATAMSLLLAGTSLAFVLGFPLLASISERFGWRAAFFVAGIPGLILTVILLLTVRDPRERNSVLPAAQDKPPSLGRTFAFIRSQRSVPHIMIGSTITTAVSSGHIAWTVPMLMRAHAMTLSNAAWVMSFTVGAMAAVGNIFGGLIVDRLARRDVRWFALAPACFVMIIGVLQAGADLVPTVGLAILMLAAWSLVNGFVFGPVAATVQGLVLPRMRGITGSCISFLVNVVGSGIGAVVVGLISDKLALRSGPHSIQIALACVAFVQVWGFFHLMLASRTIRADFVRVDELTRL